MSKDALEDTFYAGQVTENFPRPDAPDFGEGNPESVFTEQGIIRIAGYDLKSSVYYAVTGGPGGKGYMLIQPQDEQLGQNNSKAAAALINFLGALTADQFTGDGNQVVQPGVPQRYAIQSIAAVSLRIEFDFAAGTSTTDAIMMINLPTTEGDEDTLVPQPVEMLRIGPKAFFARPV